uniref:Pollen Ole e 1 allergen and extensin family protein n=1 Tax=Picea sitchensis TaxID=3332 RepID=A9NYX9_PICSI|nr:unknown [Picea sitchensis]
MASKQNVVCAILLCIVYTCSSASANSGAQQKPISVVLKGRVVCHACSLDEENFSDAGYIISGAVVAVECRAGLNRKTNAGLVSIEGKTDKNGEFKVELPGSIISSILLCSSSSDDHNPTLKGYCSARLLSSSPQEKCNVPSSTTSSSDQLIFTSDGNGIRTFTFPSLSYHSGSKLCSHKDITISSDHESLQAGRALHEVGTGSSSDKDALFPHGNLPPLPKSVLGFPPLDLPLPLPPHLFLNFPPLPLDLPLPLPPQPFLNCPPLPVSVPLIPASISPLPAGIPFPYPPPFPSTIPSRFHKLP